MYTKQEIERLNKMVDIGILFTFLGCPVKQLRPLNKQRRDDWRCPAWFRGGDNPNGIGVTYNYSRGKFQVTDFTRKTFSNLDLIDFMRGYCENVKTFRQALDLMAFASGKGLDDGVNPNIIEGVNYESPKLTEPVPIDFNVMNTFQYGLHPYWHERGYTPDIANHFGLGFCTYGFLNNRLTIPILDENKRLVAIQAKTPDKDLEPKYLFTNPTEGESAKLTLYNFWSAAQFAKQKGWIGLVESSSSVWRAHQFGMYNFVATLGTSVTDRQIYLLKMLGVEVVILFDFDNEESLAGQVAAVKVAERLKSEYVHSWIGNFGFIAGFDDLNLMQAQMVLKNARKFY